MKKLLGILVVAVVVAAVLGSLSWARHMFVIGLNPFMWYVFVFVSLLIGVPLLIRGFRWVKGRWGGDVSYTPAVLFAIAGLSWAIAGVYYNWTSDATLDLQVHDTYYVTHYFYVKWAVVIFFGALAGIYYFFSNFFARAGFRIVGYVHFWVSFIGSYIFLWPGRVYPMPLSPRRYIDYGGVMPMREVLPLVRVEILIVLAMQMVFVGVVVYAVGKMLFRGPK